MKRIIIKLLGGLLLALASLQALADPLPRDVIAERVVPPFSLGEAINDKGVWQLLNSGGAEAGYVFETGVLAPLPGFSGAAINVLVTLDLDGTFMDARLLSHNEPIFVSGLGEAPFHQFFEQYRGLSISQSLVVGSPYGASGGGDIVYLDGVTKATASVRIAHDSILAAALAVVREKMQGVELTPPAEPDMAYDEPLDWPRMLEQGLVGRLTVTNAEVDALFKGTIWQNDDPEATDDPDGIYTDLYVVDLGPPSIARTVLGADTLDELDSFREVSETDEPLLLIEAGRHGLVSDDFIRNTAPDLIGLEQDGLPVALRDADLYVELHDDMPPALQDAAAMILRTDRRLGFDPSRDWDLTLLATRDHGVFQVETGSVHLTLTHATDPRFFLRNEPVKKVPPWVDAIRNRAGDLIVLGVALAAGLVIMLGWLPQLSAHRYFTPMRLTFLAAMVVFVGWYGQGQLSIVTVLGTLRAAVENGSFAFLIYDPFSLLIWAVTIVGFALWGRGLFCGWLCPFGAMQELADWVARRLRLPQYTVPARWDQRLKSVKFVVLAGLVAVVFIAPDAIDKAAEVEPFKTAITVQFQREWYYVAYAAFWLLLSMVVFKGFCRYVCPLGAVMVLGGMLRGRDWIPRRVDCGSPCQLCKVKCRYGSIKPSGEVAYSECFQCLDCVTIHEDPAQCVPLILAARRQSRRVAA